MGLINKMLKNINLTESEKYILYLTHNKDDGGSSHATKIDNSQPEICHITKKYYFCPPKPGAIAQMVRAHDS